MRCLITGSMLFLSLFWTFCQVSGSGFASGQFLLCNSSLVNLDNWTYYGVFNNSVIFEQYHGIMGYHEFYVF